MAAESEPQPLSEPGRPERVGPLELLRTTKADGRALLIYSGRKRGEDEAETPTEPTP
ncbi:MAG TPA: hypothetical protein VHW67_05800 [Solirubrobacteraceae bacterium]|jgi:hypothetical protein|nr:hypothetical protein [Solirubrobacteraceae bacterium]